MPAKADGRRRQILRSPVGDSSSRAAHAERIQARRLLALAGDDVVARRQIADRLCGWPRRQALPSEETVQAWLRGGIPTHAATTVERYLLWWVSARMVDEGTRRSYASHIKHHLAPFLGDIPLERLNAGHIEAMFAGIALRSRKIVESGRPRSHRGPGLCR